MDGMLLLAGIVVAVVALLAGASRVLDRMPEARLPVLLLPLAAGVVLGVHTLRLPWGMAGYGFALMATVACALALASVTLMILRRTRPTGRRGLLGLVLLLAGFYATWTIGERSGVRAADREANRQTIGATGAR